MTFDEFFKKKRIDLDVLEKAQPSLFSEFKIHFEQMGEKSFDHTKKYWFNKLRGEYPLAIEAKTEKVKIENQLAEQTVTEAMIEEGVPKPAAPKLGFVPKFKAATTPKPAEEEKPKEEETVKEATAPKLGFTPKFRAANIPKTVVEDTPKSEEPVKGEEAPAESKPAPKLGFTPKFRAANIPKVVVEDKPETEEHTKEAEPEPPAENKAPQPYKPRFNMKNIPPKKEGE